MKEHQIRALEQGLAAFDAAQTSRRRRRRTLAAALVVVVAGTGAAILLRGPAPVDPPLLAGSPGAPGTVVAAARRPLPAYVHLIEDSTQLALELEEANACERVGRRGSRVYIVECTDSRP
ncbi:MAG: hypothetical protein U0625_04965 [Phycisphaerales bacterium]